MGLWSMLASGSHNAAQDAAVPAGYPSTYGMMRHPGVLDYLTRGAVGYDQQLSAYQGQQGGIRQFQIKKSILDDALANKSITPGEYTASLLGDEALQKAVSQPIQEVNGGDYIQGRQPVTGEAVGPKFQVNRKPDTTIYEQGPFGDTYSKFTGRGPGNGGGSAPPAAPRASSTYTPPPSKSPGMTPAMIATARAAAAAALRARNGGR